MSHPFPHPLGVDGEGNIIFPPDPPALTVDQLRGLLLGAPGSALVMLGRDRYRALTCVAIGRTFAPTALPVGAKPPAEVWEVTLS